jgi:hypothetical protein
MALLETTRSKLWTLTGFNETQGAFPGRRLQQPVCIQRRRSCLFSGGEYLLAHSGLQGRATTDLVYFG